MDRARSILGQSPIEPFLDLAVRIGWAVPALVTLADALAELPGVVAFQFSTLRRSSG
jgi:hypothetical protein